MWKGSFEAGSTIGTLIRSFFRSCFKKQSFRPCDFQNELQAQCGFCHPILGPQNPPRFLFLWQSVISGLLRRTHFCVFFLAGRRQILFSPYQWPRRRVSKIGWLHCQVPSLAFARAGFYSSQFLRGGIGRYSVRDGRMQWVYEQLECRKVATEDNVSVSERRR